MKEDTKKLLRAFREVYLDFARIMEQHDSQIRKDETVELFEIAWNDSLLGEILREEVLNEYRGILEQEQAEQVAREEAEAREAMII